MIRLKLNEMLETRGMSAYALHVKSKKKLHQSVISKIKNNESKALQLDTLDMLCKLLDCQPADLIVYESGDTTQSASTTQNVARATQSAKHTQNVITTQSASDSENEYTMTVKDVVAVLESSGLSLKPRTVREKAKKGLLKGKQGKQDHWFFRQSDVGEFWTIRGKE
jgi:putative transcriptional regulator